MPRNPLLFSLMHRMHLVERIGSGIRLIRQSLNSYGLEEPEIETDDNWFSLSFRRPNVSDSLEGRVLLRDENRKETGNKTGKNLEEEILSIIVRNPRVTLDGLAKAVGQSLKRIEWQVNRLKESGRLKREGSKKSGSWEIQPASESRNENRKETRKETGNKTGKNLEEEILSVIALNPRITLDGLSEAVGQSLKRIEWQVNRLKESGRLKRVGSKKSGSWEIHPASVFNNENRKETGNKIGKNRKNRS